MMDRGKRILIVSPALTMGGVERSSSNLANTLVEMGVEVIFVALFKQPKFFELDKKVVFIEPPDFNISHLAFFKSIRWLRKVVKGEKPDVVYAYTRFYSAITCLALAGTAMKIFASERSSPFYRWPAKIRWISKVAFQINPPLGVVSQTTIAAEVQKKRFKERTRFAVIHNPVRDIKLFPEVSRENIILAVGRFGDANKGFDRLIDAFSKSSKAKAWRLAFAGGRSNNDYLIEQAKTLGIEQNIDFLGVVAQLDEVYAKASIFVIPSRSEGFPNALCEAMAAGLPCISFDFVAGPRDLIADGQNGILVENGNVDALAKAIDELIVDVDLRNQLGTRALLIREKLAALHIARQHLQFFYNDGNKE